jgi:hypothetical protein
MRLWTGHEVYNSLYLCVVHMKNALYTSRLRERTDRRNITGDFIDLGFSLLGRKETKVALEALMRYCGANKGRVCNQSGPVEPRVVYREGTDRNHMRAPPWR